MDSISQQLTFELARLLTDVEAAELLGLSPQTLRNQRCQRTTALPHIKIGGAVRYRRSDIDAFINANVVVGCVK